MECKNFEVMNRILIHTLELKLWHFEVFPICLYLEAMSLQCFPPTLRECASFRNLVLLEYGPGYSVWFLDIFFCLVWSVA